MVVLVFQSMDIYHCKVLFNRVLITLVALVLYLFNSNSYKVFSSTVLTAPVVLALWSLDIYHHKVFFIIVLMTLVALFL